MKRMTPHLGVAAGVLLLALVATLGILTGGLPSFPVEREDLTVPVDAGTQRIIGHAALLDPVIPDAGGPRERNPFNLRAERQQYQVSIPPPPPPSLASPQPPALPLDTIGASR